MNGLGKVVQASAEIAVRIGRELPLILCLGAIAYGFWLWSHPAGFVCGGVLGVIYIGLQQASDIIKARETKTDKAA